MQIQWEIFLHNSSTVVLGSGLLHCLWLQRQHALAAAPATYGVPSLPNRLPAQIEATRPAAFTAQASAPASSGMQPVSAAQSPAQSMTPLPTAQPAVLTSPLQKTAAGPVFPAPLSHLARLSAAPAQLQRAFVPSPEPQDVAAVQQSVALLQHVPLHVTQSDVNPSQAMQPVGGYTMGAQPNRVAFLIGSLSSVCCMGAESGPDAVGNDENAPMLYKSRWPVRWFTGVKFGQTAADLVSRL